jgi:hypothetical protein
MTDRKFPSLNFTCTHTYILPYIFKEKGDERNVGVGIGLVEVLVCCFQAGIYMFKIKVCCCTIPLVLFFLNVKSNYLTLFF